LRGAREKDFVHMFIVFGDESSDGKQERVFAVAGVIGTREIWDSLEPFWRERTGGVPYHATDCLAGRGAYKGWSEEKISSLHNDLAGLMADFPIVGNAFAIDLASFVEIMPAVEKPEPFLYCFAHMVAGACAIIDGYNTIQKTDEDRQRAKFVFHANNDKYNAGYLYSVLAEMKRWDEVMASCEPSVEFAHGNGHVGIQAADLWAYEARNAFDNKLKGVKNESLASRLLSVETGFVRNEYFRSNIVDLRNRLERVENGLEYEKAYQKWLLKHRRNDNATARIAFAACWDAQLRKEKRIM
jgi:hypothetical protein